MTVTARSAVDLEAIVTRLAKIGAASLPSFSADGSHVAFVSDLSGSPQVWTVSVDGGWPQNITAFDDPVNGADWSPDGDRIAVSIAPGGGLNHQVYTLRPDGSDLRLHTAGGKENNRLGPWTRDGRHLFITSNRRDPASLDSFIIDVATNEWREIARSPGVGGVQDVSRDGRLALLVRVRERGDSDLYLLDLERNTERHLSPHTDKATFGNARFSADGRSVFVVTDEGRELAGLARIRLDGAAGHLEFLIDSDHGVEAFELSEDERVAAVVWNVAGRGELAVVDGQTWSVIDRPALPVDQVGDLEWSPDRSRLAFTGWGAGTTTDVRILELPQGRIRQLTSSPHPGVDLSVLPRPRLERFIAHDGLALSGWLYLPRDFHGPGPVVLSFHGGPESQERPMLNRTYYALLELGIAVFAPNVRGSSGFGKTFVHLDDRHKRFDGVRDIEACLGHVIDSGVADPSRIGITGGSYGGYMTMAGITEYPDRFAAAACVCGIINFRTFFAHTEPWMAAVSKSEYGDPVGDGDLLDRLSPIHKMDRVRTPTLVLHGANDTNVPVIEAEQMVAEIGKRNVPVELVLFPDEGHGFVKTANRVRATVETTRWFQRYLVGER